VGSLCKIAVDSAWERIDMGAILTFLRGVGAQLIAFISGWLAERGIAFGATKATQMGLVAVFSTGPFSGTAANAMALLNAFFPVDFGLGVVIGYIAFKYTATTAAIAMSRTIKFLFGG
jgi:hypothetical protein